MRVSLAAYESTLPTGHPSAYAIARSCADVRGFNGCGVHGLVALLRFRRPERSLCMGYQAEFGRCNIRYGVAPGTENRSNQMRVLPRQLAVMSCGLGCVAALAAPALAAQIIGTANSDELRGTNRADTIRAGAGDDRVWARRGSDEVHLGPGHDWTDLGWGNDVVDGGDGHDTIHGGPGADEIDAGDPGDGDADTIYGGPGADRIVYLAGGHAFGGGGADTIVSGIGENYISGGDGDDRILTASGNEREQGRDVFRCGPGFDVVVYWIQLDPLDKLVNCERVRFFPNG